MGQQTSGSVRSARMGSACKWPVHRSETIPWEGEGGNEGSQGAGGTFGRLTLFNTATSQELLCCNHSKAHNFTEKWEGKEGGGGGATARVWKRTPPATSCWPKASLGGGVQEGRWGGYMPPRPSIG